MESMVDSSATDSDYDSNVWSWSDWWESSPLDQSISKRYLLADRFDCHQGKCSVRRMVERSRSRFSSQLQGFWYLNDEIPKSSQPRIYRLDRCLCVLEVKNLATSFWFAASLKTWAISVEWHRPVRLPIIFSRSEASTIVVWGHSPHDSNQPWQWPNDGDFSM